MDFEHEIAIPEVLPLLPVRDIVVFPYMILPLFVGREPSVKAVEEALAQDRIIFLASQREISDENPTPDRIYNTGTIAMIMRMRKLPDGRVKILVQGLMKGEIQEYSQELPFYKVKVQKILEEPGLSNDLEMDALMRNIRENLEKIISLGKVLSPDILMILEEVHDPGRLANLIASNLGLEVNNAQDILETHDVKERLKKIYNLLSKELEVLAMQAKIRSQARDEMTKGQKEYFLREQMKAIRTELGDMDSKQEEVDELRERIETVGMPPDVKEEALKQLNRLERMHPDASESAVVRTYLDWLVDLPWSSHTEDTLDLKKAKGVLDEDHFGLEKIKERILEFLAVCKLKHKMKGPILCFMGPPGVGKTSLGRSIARAMGREFVRISLGGLRDEAEIRGHRRTYVGAMPGKIIQGLKQVGTNNPVFVLDEIEKLGADFRGDPSSALLEVLDPEQNYSFRDHYLNVPFDLSNVMFIATANLVDTVPSALRDRMEVIQLSGYSEDEKIAIARKYLVPKQLEANGLTEEHVKFTDKALRGMITLYTREAGLRNLERSIASICRKIARRIAEGEKEPVVMTHSLLHSFLGPAKFLPEEEQKRDEVGVATGLAWTPYGGEILYVEATKMRGRGNLILTGQLGDIMKESAQAAMSYTRANSKKLGVSEDFFARHEVHVHVPAGAISKDGPSAGITIATSIISLITGIAVRKDVAMTGEISLVGKVLPIGGVKEKVLGAMRQKIKTIILPYRNKRDLEEIPAKYKSKLKFILVRTLDDVLRAALVKVPAGIKKETHVTEEQELVAEAA